MKHLAMGPCEITFTPYDADMVLQENQKVVIPLTLKEEDTLLTVTQEMYDIMMDQIPGAYIQNFINGESTFTCSVLQEMDLLSGLSNTIKKGDTGYLYGTYGKAVKYGKLTIHPLSAGTSTTDDVTCFKTACSVTLNSSYKEEGYLAANLSFGIMANTTVPKEDPKYGELLMVGDYTVAVSPTSVKASK